MEYLGYFWGLGTGLLAGFVIGVLYRERSKKGENK